MLVVGILNKQALFAAGEAAVVGAVGAVGAVGEEEVLEEEEALEEEEEEVLEEEEEVLEGGGGAGSPGGSGGPGGPGGSGGTGGSGGPGGGGGGGPAGGNPGGECGDSPEYFHPLLAFLASPEWLQSASSTDQASTETRSSSAFDDTAICLKGPGDVFREEAAYFRDQGHALVKDVFKATSVIDHVVTAYNGIESIGQVGFEDAASGDKEFMVATAVTPHFPVLKGLVASPSLHLAAAAMLGSPLDHVCIWIDKIFNKNGGDLSTHWHTDGQANRMPHWLNGLTAWVPFQNTSKDNGLLRYVSQQVSLEATVNTGEKGERQASAGDPTEDEMADVEFMEVGDVAFHHLNTRHGSFPNPSNDTRAALSVMFVAMPTKSNGGHNDKDSDNEPQFCTQHPNCGFATLTRVLSGAAELCRTCDFAFNDTKKHLLMYDQLSMAEEELDTCVDDVFALCRQVFNLISQKDNLVWLDSALQNCAQLKALSLPNPGQSRDPLPLPKSRIRSHLSMYTGGGGQK